MKVYRYLAAAVLGACLQPAGAALLNYGSGNISDTINPAGYGCVVDNGNWIFNACGNKVTQGMIPAGSTTKKNQNGSVLLWIVVR